VTATVKVLSVTVARLAAQPWLTEVGRQPATSVAQTKMSPKSCRLYITVILLFVLAVGFRETDSVNIFAQAVISLGPYIFFYWHLLNRL